MHFITVFKHTGNVWQCTTFFFKLNFHSNPVCYYIFARVYNWFNWEHVLDFGWGKYWIHSKTCTCKLIHSHTTEFSLESLQLPIKMKIWRKIKYRDRCNISLCKSKRNLKWELFLLKWSNQVLDRKRSTGVQKQTLTKNSCFGFTLQVYKMFHVSFDSWNMKCLFCLRFTRMRSADCVYR